MEERKQRAQVALKVYEALHREFMNSKSTLEMDFIKEVQKIVLIKGVPPL